MQMLANSMDKNVCTLCVNFVIAILEKNECCVNEEI